MSIESVLQSIQQHTPKHPLLLRKLVKELERDSSQKAKLLSELRASESSRLRLKRYIQHIFQHKDISYCLIESGISNRVGFVSEILRKVKHKILPESDDMGAFHKTLLRVSNLNAFTAEELEELFTLLDVRVDMNEAYLKKELIDAIEVLSYRITAAAIESEFITRFKHNQTVSNFIRQNKEIHALIAQHVLGIQFNPHLVTHIKTLLNESLKDVNKLQKTSRHQGASLQLSYALYRTGKQIERLILLLDLYMQPQLNPKQLSVFIKQVCKNEQNKNSIRFLLNDTLYLLAYQISEHESKTGEHYIAENKKEFVKMFVSSCIGGIVAVWMATIKILLHKLPFAPFWQSFSYSLNYASGFVGIQLMHGTLATKQPSMTAAKIAHSIDTNDNTDHQAIKSLALMVAKVSRSQFISFVGNLAVVFPLAAILAVVWPFVFGDPIITKHKALHMMHEVHPFESPAWMYACITGILLFISGIISGYFDNKVIYSNIPARLRHHPLLQKLLTKRTLIRVSKYIEHNLGSLVGNIYLGFFLGMAGFVGFIFGIPFDIRHITISSANFAIAGVTLFPLLDWKYVLVCFCGVLGIGVFNFLISFSLALFVAIRSRRVQFKEAKLLFKYILIYFKNHPADFFFAPKQERSVSEF